MRYQDKISFEKRKEHSNNILKRYEDRKPVIITNSDNNTHYKFLMLNNHTISTLLITLKKRLDIHPEDSIYVFVNKSIIPTPINTIIELYNEYKDEDGYLYMDVRKENTFG